MRWRIPVGLNTMRRMGQTPNVSLNGTKKWPNDKQNYPCMGYRLSMKGGARRTDCQTLNSVCLKNDLQLLTQHQHDAPARKAGYPKTLQKGMSRDFFLAFLYAVVQARSRFRSCTAVNKVTNDQQPQKRPWPWRCSASSIYGR